MVIYIDSAFLLNAALDWLLLYFTGYLAGLEQKWKCLFLAAVIGGFYAVLTLILPENPISWLPVKLLVGAAMLWIVYGKGKAFFRLFLTFLSLSCGLAGAVLAAENFFVSSFYYGGAYILPIKVSLLLPVSLGCFLLLFLFGKGGARHQIHCEIVKVQFDLLGERVTMRALRDSGNTLREEVSGAPVLVAEADALACVWPEHLREIMDLKQLKNPEKIIEMINEKENVPAMRLFAYRSIGTENGMMLACRAERVRIGRYERPCIWVALSPTPVSESQEYEALWGGPIDGKSMV